MGQANQHGYTKVRMESESAADAVAVKTLVFDDDSLTLEGADEGRVQTGKWTERALTEFTDLADAITDIGATPSTLVIDATTNVSTALVVPDTLYLRPAKGALFTKSGSGTIEFEGMGLVDPMSQTAVFSGFAAGDITWSGTEYPKQVSIELWDTGNDSLQDRYNRADLALVGKFATFFAYPRTLTTATAIIGENHHLRITAGDYPNTCATYGTTYWPPFLMKNYSSIIGEPGNVIHESPVDGNGYLIQGWHVRSGGGETDGMQTHLIVEGLNVVGDPAQVDISGSGSMIILGNAHYSAIRYCTFYETHNYTAVLGLYGNTGNYAYQSEIAYNIFTGIGTQAAVLLNAKSCRIANNWFDQRNSVGTTSYTAIDVEPNVANDVIEDCIIEHNTIDGRDVTDGSKYAGAMAIQAALSGSMKNITIRNNKIYGRALYPIPADNLPLANGILVTGTTELYLYGNEVRGAFQRAYEIDRCRFVIAFNNTAIQCATASGDNGAMLVQGCADSDICHNIFKKSPAAFTQAAGIVEQEVSHPVTTSGSTITNIYDVGIFKLFFDLYKGLTVTINNTDYPITGFTSHTILTSGTSIGTLTKKTFVDGDVTTGSDNIAITAHGHNTGSKVWPSTTGVVPAGLTVGRSYYVIRVDADNLKLADTLALALAGTPVNITAAAGGGTHTLTPVLTTKFSNNEYWGNKTPDGITQADGLQDRVLNSYDSNPQDYIAPVHSLALRSITAIPTNRLLGCKTEVVIDPITPRDDVGISITGADNKQTMISGSAWASGAFSYESLLSDGVLETIVIETNKDRMIGLAYADVGGRHYNTIDYACYLSAGGALQGYNLGTGSGSTPGYSASDVITLTRAGSEIRLAINGAAPFKTFTGVAVGPMYVKTSFGTIGSTLGGIVLRETGDVEALDRTASQAVLGIISATASLNFDLTAVVSQDLTISLTGAVVGDSVMLGVPHAAMSADIVFFSWVSATDVVSVRAMRGAGTPDPASGTFKATIIKS